MKLNPYLVVGSLAFALAVVGCKKSTDAPQTNGSSGSSSGTAESAAATGDPDEAAALKLRWAVGGRFGHRMEVTQTMQLPAMPGMPGGGKPTTQEFIMGQDYSLNVLRERPGGGREVELEFQSANVSVSMNGNEVLGFDTRGEATGDESYPGVKPLRQMVGKKLTLLLDASNMVERVEGLTEFRDKVFGDAASSQDPMAAMFGEDYFKQIMSQGCDLPAQPVKPGATWPSRFDIIMGPLGKATLDLTYTFKGWEQREKRRCAAMTYAGSISPKAGEQPSGPLAAMMSMTGGQCSGKSWFDPAIGMIIDNQVDQTIQVRIKLPVPPGPGRNAAPPAPPAETTMKQNVSIKLVEDSRK